MLLGIGFTLQLFASDPIQIQEPQRKEPVSFEDEILPILRENCLACHSSSEKQGNLVLESPQGLLKGGDTGAGAVPGQGAESLVLRLTSHQDDPVMPPEGNDVAANNLTPAELGLLKLWIDQGAKGSGGIDSLSPKQWQPLPTGVHPVQAIALSEDGQFIACSRANQICLYHVPTGQLVTRLSDASLDSLTTTGIAHRDLVQSLTFNVDGDLLASGGFREVKLWRRPKDVQSLNLRMDTEATAVAVSPDKHWIAVGTVGNSIQIVDATKGQPGPKLEGHTDRVTALRFTADGNRLASGSADGTVRLWNIPDGTPAGIIETPASVQAIELVNQKSEAGEHQQILATSDTGKQVRIWNLPAGPPQTIATGNKVDSQSSKIQKMASSHDGTHLALLHEDNTLQILSLSEAHLADENPIATWKPETAITSLAFLPRKDDTLALMTAGTGGVIQIWSLPDHALMATWIGHPLETTSLAISSDGQLAASGYENGTTTLWNLALSEPAKPAVPIETHAPIRVCVLSPSRTTLAIAGLQEGKPAVFLKDVKSGTLRATLLGHTAKVTSLSFSADESRLLSGSEDKTIRSWDLSDPSVPQMALLEVSTSATTLAANADGSQCLAGFSDNTLRLHQLSDGELLMDFKGHSGGLLACGYSATQPYSVSGDRTVRFWNSADGSQLRTFSLPSDITAFAVSDDRARMAFGCKDEQVRIYQTDNGSVLHTLKVPQGVSESISFSSTAQSLSVLTETGWLSVWDVPSGTVRESILRPEVVSAWFELAGDLLTTGSQLGQLATPELRFARDLETGTKPITSMLFHTEGKTLCMTDSEGGLRAFNTQTGQQLFSTSHGGKVNHLSISPDEKIMATSGENGVVRLWQTSGAAFGPSQIADLPGAVKSSVFSPDTGKLIVTVTGEFSTAHVFDPSTGNPLQHFSVGDDLMIGSVTPPFQSPQLATGIDVVTVTQTQLQGWSTDSVRILSGHTQPITTLFADPERPHHLFSGSLDGTIRRWNLDSGQSVQQFNHGGPVTAIAVSPDGQQLASSSENHTAKLFRINGQLIKEMRGDLRLKVDLLRTTQQQSSATARVTVAKRRVDEAEKDLPKKTEAEKTLSENLAKANQDVAEKQSTLDKAMAEKITAEKAAIDASSLAKAALLEKEQAERLAQKSADALKTAKAVLAQLQLAMRDQPENPQLMELADKAEQDVTARQAESQQLAAAITTPTQNSVKRVAEANAAAQKVNDGQKPFNEAATALKTAQGSQNLLSQQHVLASKELQLAKDLIPIRNATLERAEAAKTQADEAVAQASEAVKNSEQPIRSISFSPDGSLIATAGDFANFHTWDGKTGEAVAAFGGHTMTLNQVAFVDNQRIVSVSKDQSCRVWQVNPAWVLERTIGQYDDPTIITHRATAVDFNRDSTELIVASGVPSRSGELHVFKIDDGSRKVYLPRAHDDVIYAARFSPDGTRIASGGADRFLRTFDVSSSAELRRFEGHTNYVLGVSWKSDGETIATSSADNTIKLWEAETGDQRRTINQQLTKHVTAVQFIGDTDNVVSSSGDKRVRIHNGNNGGVSRSFPEVNTWLHCVAATPDSTVIAAGDANGTITLWNGTNGQQLQKFSQED